MICRAGAVVIVPFPFTDRQAAKRRPALILSSRQFNSAGHSVLGMITSSTAAAWPGDTPINDLAAAGLSTSCSVRLKLFTLDNRLLTRQSGALSDTDLRAVELNLQSVLAELARAS